MTDTQQKTVARKFATDWENKGYEKNQSQTFRFTLLSDVLGVSDAGNFITFEEQVKLDHTSLIEISKFLSVFLMLLYPLECQDLNHAGNTRSNWDIEIKTRYLIQRNAA